jgi:hypothetical protein
VKTRVSLSVFCTQCGNYGTINIAQFLARMPMSHTCNPMEWTWDGLTEWEDPDQKFVYVGESTRDLNWWWND